MYDFFSIKFTPNNKLPKIGTSEQQDIKKENQITQNNTSQKSIKPTSGPPQTPSLNKRRTEMPKKTSWLSSLFKFFTFWNEKRKSSNAKNSILKELESENYKTKEQRLNLLKNKLDNKILDLAIMIDLRNEGKIDEFEMMFLINRDLYEKKEMDQLSFAKSSIHALKDMATEEKGLMDILCEQCDIEKGSDTHVALLEHCLTDPDLSDVPLVITDISGEHVDPLKAANNPNTNPNPEFCKKVMDAKNVNEIAEVFNTFFSDANGDPRLESQKDVYANGNLLRADLERSLLKVNVNGKEILLSGNESSLKSSGKEDYQLIKEGKQINGLPCEDVFQLMLEQIQKQGELAEEDALKVLKQIVLAYRGQNGVADGYNLISVSLLEHNKLMAANSGPKISMEFDKNFTLTRKTEDAPMISIQSTMTGQFFSTECRFKFPDDPENKGIRTQLPITSTRKESIDGRTIEWTCPFRENPPNKVIFYGGCKKSEPSVSQGIS
ncbi:MAG: hypothetical protein LBI77_03050 [Puniceicoccales bacterium]|jgi:hypothetical protein|nr:hypothetical protein [Puniceicoccales bacterium]